MNNDSSLPSKKWHERKTFASDTLKLINLRLGYYRKVLKDNNITDKRRQRVTKKYEHNLKVRKLLNRAVKNLYI